MLSTEKAARMCPRCGEDSWVYETRKNECGATVRRRKCKKCGTKFETIELLSRIIFEKNKKNLSKP